MRPRANGGLGERLLDGAAQRTGGDEAPRDPHTGAGPGDAGGVLVHVARHRARDDRATARDRADQSAVAGMTDHRVTVGHGARVGDPVHQTRVRGHRQWARGQAPVPGGEHAHGRVGEPPQGGVEQAMIGILGGGRCDQHKRRIARRQVHCLGGRLPHERSDHVHMGGPGTRILELGERGDERELATGPAVDVVQRRQADLLACVVERQAPELEPSTDRQAGALPECAAPGGAGQASAERVDRESRSRVGIDVGDQRGAGHAGELSGERGTEGENVVDHDVGAQLVHKRERVASRVDDRLVKVQRRRADRKRAVLGGGGEREPVRLDRGSPAFPGLQGDVVAARKQRAAERDHRKRVTGVAESAEQDPGAAHAARRLARRPGEAARAGRPW
ncbi:MAG TPA: hypothetical protein VK781_11815 [Solirubrobacteraceae bacterium]|nr:hypothetical protein [Solirubrobacteraceae bacterium]